jgi:predicted nucleotidyltransferase
MKGWPHESARHSLSARGISTRGIPHVAHPDPDVEVVYQSRKKPREFKGSGLEDIDVDDVVMEAQKFVDVFNLHNYDLKDYDVILNDFMREIEERYPKARGKNPILAKKLTEIMSMGLEMDKIYVYGSRVTGYYDAGSDIDVYIVIKGTIPLATALGQFREASLDDRAWPISDNTLQYINHEFMEALRFRWDMREFEPINIKRPPGWIYDKNGNKIRMDVKFAFSYPPPKYLHAKKIWEASG